MWGGEKHILREAIPRIEASSVDTDPDPDPEDQAPSLSHLWHPASKPLAETSPELLPEPQEEGPHPESEPLYV